VAEDVGFEYLSVMDHMWQFAPLGPPEDDMLEAYTTLGFLAGQTSSIKLLTMVTAGVYRDPGLLAKMVTTLDVLSGGRAWLGIGAGWYAEEAEGLGLCFPPTAERFERLEEALQICLQMWSESDTPFDGRHYHLKRTLNAPNSVSRPHPPILIGGNGERKTLRLVATYAQACNLFPAPDLARKLTILREHCERLGRRYDDIEKTTAIPFDVGARGERVAQTVDELGNLAELGFDVVHGSVAGDEPLRELELLGTEVIPAVAEI
jgi:F420-dependent oxidoreductase-like protein